MLQLPGSMYLILWGDSAAFLGMNDTGFCEIILFSQSGFLIKAIK